MRENSKLSRALAVGLIGLLAGCSRTVTYTYEPNAHRPQDFDLRAERECAKFGDRADYAGHFLADYGRHGVNYVCTPRR